MKRTQIQRIFRFSYKNLSSELQKMYMEFPDISSEEIRFALENFIFSEYQNVEPDTEISITPDYLKQLVGDEPLPKVKLSLSGTKK